jgi:hypothetical protein
MVTGVMRYKYGEMSPREVVVASADAIEIGDIIVLNSGTAKKASLGVTTSASLLLAQEKVHTTFLGVSMSRHVALDTKNLVLTVATRGVFEFPCASATFTHGEMLGADWNGTDFPLDQKVISTVTTDDIAEAIGRAAKVEAAAVTKVLIEIVSSIFHGGVQAIG